METRLLRINPSLEQDFYTQGLQVHEAKTEPMKTNKSSERICHVLKVMLTQRDLRILLRLLSILFLILYIRM